MIRSFKVVNEIFHKHYFFFFTNILVKKRIESILLFVSHASCMFTIIIIWHLCMTHVSSQNGKLLAIQFLQFSFCLFFFFKISRIHWIHWQFNGLTNVTNFTSLELYIHEPISTERIMFDTWKSGRFTCRSKNIQRTERAVCGVFVAERSNANWRKVARAEKVVSENHDTIPNVDENNVGA